MKKEPQDSIKLGNENWDFTNFMKYDSGLKSVHRSGIMLKPFEQGYVLTNKIHCAK